jgi:hypothetical protein
MAIASSLLPNSEALALSAHRVKVAVIKVALAIPPNTIRRMSLST